MKNTLSVALLLCLLASTSAVGCSDTAADSDGGGGHAGDHSHGEEAADCTAISDVCHAVDEQTTEAHDCHEVAHANDAHDCADIKADCIAHCSELAAGGAGGSAH